MATARQYIDEWHHVDEERKAWYDLWMDLRDFILPGSGHFPGDKTNSPGDRYIHLHDLTATRALRVLGAGMQSGLTSPARPWFRLEMEDDELNEIWAVKEWLHEVSKRMYAVFAGSNFYNSVHDMYIEEAVYGQAASIIDEDDDEIIRLKRLTCGEYAMVQDENGRVDGLYRIWPMTLRQMVRKFGIEKLPANLQALYKVNQGVRPGNPFKFYDVLHVIRSREFFDPTKVTSDNFPVASVYIYLDGQDSLDRYKDDKEILMVSGYKDWPLITPRWMVTGSNTYGRSPGQDSLGDIRMLQELQYDKLQALAKVIDPPVKAPAELKDQVNLEPGEITYGSGDALDKLSPIYALNFNVQQINGDIQDVRQQIKEGFFNDLFLMILNSTGVSSRATATEIAAKQEEKLIMLGPTIERQFHELLKPTIDRTFNVMLRAGRIPPPPQELLMYFMQARKVKINIRYISLLAQAQQLVTTQSIERTVGFTMNLAQINQEVLDKVDMDQAIDEYANAVGSPPTIVRSDEDVSVIRQQRAALMQQQMQMQQQMAQADIANKLGNAKVSKEGDTALGAATNEGEVAPV